MEYLSQYEYTIKYINGPDNTMADALSRFPEGGDDGVPDLIANIFEIKSDESIVKAIRDGYDEDAWCKGIIEDLNANLLDEKLGISWQDGLLFIGGRLVVLSGREIREHLYRLAHDSLGHFGIDKSYRALQQDFYWPNMWRDLFNAYVPSCASCQRNKSCTSRPPGPLHPLNVPNKCFEAVAIDFVGPLPKDEGFDALVTMMDRLGADLQLAPCKTDMSAEEFAGIFFDK
jgi:hypothetical protein